MDRDKRYRGLRTGAEGFNSETGRAAQRKSVQKRYENKTGRELALALLNSKLPPEEMATLQARLGTKEKLTQEIAADHAMLTAAKEGNPTAYDKLMRKAGIMVDKTEVDANVELPKGLSKDQAKDFIAQLNK